MNNKEMPSTKTISDSKVAHLSEVGTWWSCQTLPDRLYHGLIIFLALALVISAFFLRTPDGTLYPFALFKLVINVLSLGILLG